MFCTPTSVPTVQYKVNQVDLFSMWNCLTLLRSVHNRVILGSRAAAMDGDEAGPDGVVGGYVTVGSMTWPLKNIKNGKITFR